MENITGLYIILFLVSLVLAAFFCSAETAFIGMQRLRLHHLIQTGHPKAKLVGRIVEHPEKFLATVLLGINFFETAIATIGTIIAVSLWGQNLGLALATILVAIITIIFAELIPKSLGVRYGEKIALAYARPIEVIAIVLYPFVFILNHIGIGFTKLVEGDFEPKPTISEEEFRTAIRVGEAEGVVEERTAEMLHEVFDLSNRPISEVMVPRPEVVFIQEDSRISDFLALYAQSPLSRYPVCQGNMDNVAGILSVKDVLLGLAKGTVNNDSPIDSLVRPVYFTPAVKPINELLAEMRDNNYRMAIVVDEFGGTAGIATLTQLLGEIVGPLGSEMTAIEKDYEVIDEHTFQIDAGMRVDEVNEELGLGLPEGDYETVAGFILHLLRRLPKQGEQLRYKGLKLVITKMRGVKIEEVLVSREKVAKEPKEHDTAPAG